MVLAGCPVGGAGWHRMCSVHSSARSLVGQLQASLHALPDCNEGRKGGSPARRVHHQLLQRFINRLLPALTEALVVPAPKQPVPES